MVLFSSSEGFSFFFQLFFFLTKKGVLFSFSKGFIFLFLRSFFLGIFFQRVCFYQRIVVVFPKVFFFSKGVVFFFQRFFFF